MFPALLSSLNILIALVTLIQGFDFWNYKPYLKEIITTLEPLARSNVISIYWQITVGVITYIGENYQTNKMYDNSTGICIIYISLALINCITPILFV